MCCVERCFGLQAAPLPRGKRGRVCAAREKKGGGWWLGDASIGVLVGFAEIRGRLQSVVAAVEGVGRRERHIAVLVADDVPARSEERRVGKECRSRWSPYH